MGLAGKKKIFDGRYEILGIVGRGSRSVVYHARNIDEGNTEVALKVLLEIKKDKLPTSEKLRREALAMVSSHHKYVVRLDDFHSVGDLCYLSMEFAPEADLRKYVTRIGSPLSPAQTELFLTQAAEALDYVHKVGIIHRDIKPDNILVIDDKSIRLGDFGVALLPGDDSSPTDLKNAVGTMDYMAPEVLDGTAYDKKSDIYSLGVAFYEMASGIHPFAGASLLNQLEIRKNESIPSLSQLVPAIPEYLSDVIAQAMNYDPQKRFASAKELLQHLALKKIQRSAPTPKRSAEKAPRESLLAQPKAVVEAPQTVLSQTVPQQAPAPIDPAPRIPEVLVSPVEETEVIAEVVPMESGQSTEEIEPKTNSKIVDHPMRASRESRAPTIFITKELTEKIRKDSSLREALQPPVSQPRKSVSRPAATSLPRKPLNVKAIAGGSMAFLLVLLAFSYLKSPDAPYVEEVAPKKTEEISAPLLPPFTGGELAFPEVPSGTFVGAIDNILPDRAIPLSIISNGERRTLTFILGVSGWLPVTISMDAKRDAALRVASNGFVVDFTGQGADDAIEGSFTNAVTGESGNWIVKPAK